MTASAPTAPDAPFRRFSHREIMVIFSGLMLGLFLAAIDGTMVSVALPTIVGELGGLDQLSWVVTAYLLTSTVTVPLYGKVSDLYGRRIVFQAAILVYLAGTVLIALSQNMGQLIAFRGIQGLGGGGLMAMAFIIVGDIVPPRERGRYMAYFSGVWAFASVAGPLLGGFLVDSVSWRGIFLVKVPFAIAALVVTSRVLHLPVRHERRRIDVEGAGLLVAGVSCLLLVAVWGGNEYPWGSPTIIGLAGAGLLLSTLFVAWEARVAEPIIPLRLFRIPVFRVCIVLSLLVGSAMFGAMTFLPLFLQAVTGASATESGLLMTPLMAGITIASVVAGRTISRTGRYRVWPIAGMAAVVVALALLSRLDSTATGLSVAPLIALLGAGVGMAMPVLSVAIQNAVPYRDMGAATSAGNFFRTMGGTLGVAVFGAVLTARLHSELARLLPAGAGGLDLEVIANSPEQIRALPAPVADAVVEALARGVTGVFLAALPVAVLGLVAAFFLREIPLRETVETAAPETAPVAPEEPALSPVPTSPSTPAR